VESKIEPKSTKLSSSSKIEPSSQIEPKSLKTDSKSKSVPKSESNIDPKSKFGQELTKAAQSIKSNLKNGKKSDDFLVVVVKGKKNGKNVEEIVVVSKEKMEQKVEPVVVESKGKKAEPVVVESKGKKVKPVAVVKGKEVEPVVEPIVKAGKGKAIIVEPIIQAGKGKTAVAEPISTKGSKVEPISPSTTKAKGAKVEPIVETKPVVATKGTKVEPVVPISNKSEPVTIPAKKPIVEPVVPTKGKGKKVEPVVIPTKAKPLIDAVKSMKTAKFNTIMTKIIDSVKSSKDGKVVKGGDVSTKDGKKDEDVSAQNAKKGGKAVEPEPATKSIPTKSTPTSKKTPPTPPTPISKKTPSTPPTPTPTPTPTSTKKSSKKTLEPEPLPEPTTIKATKADKGTKTVEVVEQPPKTVLKSAKSAPTPSSSPAAAAAKPTATKLPKLTKSPLPSPPEPTPSSKSTKSTKSKPTPPHVDIKPTAFKSTQVKQPIVEKAPTTTPTTTAKKASKATIDTLSMSDHDSYQFGLESIQNLDVDTQNKINRRRYRDFETALGPIGPKIMRKSASCRPTTWGRGDLTPEQLIYQYSGATTLYHQLKSDVDRGVDILKGETPFYEIPHPTDSTQPSIPLPSAIAESYLPFLQRLSEIQSYHEWEAVEGMKRRVKMRVISHWRSTFLDPTELAKRTHEIDEQELYIYMQKFINLGILKRKTTPSAAPGAAGSTTATTNSGHPLGSNSNTSDVSDDPQTRTTWSRNSGIEVEDFDISSSINNRRHHLQKGLMNLPSTSNLSQSPLPPRLYHLIPENLATRPRNTSEVAQFNYQAQMHILRANYVSLHDMSSKEEVVYAALEDLGLIPDGMELEPRANTPLTLQPVDPEDGTDTHPRYIFPAAPLSSGSRKRHDAEATRELLAATLATLSEAGFFTQEPGHFDIPLRDYSHLRNPHSISSHEVPSVPILKYRRTPAGDDAISPSIRLFDHHINSLGWDKLGQVQRLLSQEYRIELVKDFEHHFTQSVRFFLRSEQYLSPRYFQPIKRLLSTAYLNNMIDIRYSPHSHLKPSFVERMAGLVSSRPKFLAHYQSRLYLAATTASQALQHQHNQLISNTKNKDGNDVYDAGASTTNDETQNPHNLVIPGAVPHTIIPLGSAVDSNQHLYDNAHFSYLTRQQTQVDSSKSRRRHPSNVISPDMGIPTDPLGVYPFGSIKPLARGEFMDYLSQLEQRRYKNEVNLAFSHFYQNLLSSQVILDNAPVGSRHTGFTWVLKHLMEYEVIKREKPSPQVGINGDNTTMRQLSTSLGVEYVSIPTESDIIDLEQVAETSDSSQTAKKIDEEGQQQKEQKDSPLPEILQHPAPLTFKPSPSPTSPDFNPANAYPLPLTFDPSNPAQTKEALIVEGLQRMGLVGFHSGRYAQDIFLPVSSTPLTSEHIVTPTQTKVGKLLQMQHHDKQQHQPHSEDHQTDTTTPPTTPQQPTTMTITEALMIRAQSKSKNKALKPVTSPVERIFAALVQSGIYAIEPPMIELMGATKKAEKH
jgi:hypothetical protein